MTLKLWGQEHGLVRLVLHAVALCRPLVRIPPPFVLHDVTVLAAVLSLLLRLGLWFGARAQPTLVSPSLPPPPRPRFLIVRLGRWEP